MGIDVAAGGPRRADTVEMPQPASGGPDEFGQLRDRDYIAPDEGD
jgi:hypothetical protein